MATPGNTSGRSKLIWVVLLALGGIVGFAGYNSPAALQIQNNSLKPSCPQDIYTQLGYKCGEFDAVSNPVLSMEVENIERSHHFLALQALPIISKEATSHKFVFDLEVSSFVVGQSQNILKTLSQKVIRKVTFDCPSVNGQISCAPQTFEEVMGVTDSHYIFVVNILNANLIRESKVEDIRLAFVTFSPIFEDYLTYFKWALFVIAIVTAFFYQSRISALSSDLLSDQHKHIRLLGITLILFNEPFIKYTAMTGEFVFTAITVVVIAAQTAILTLFWFGFLQNASADEDKSPRTRGWIKLIAFVHFVVSTISYGVLASDQLQNPFTSLLDDPAPLLMLCRGYLYAFVAFTAIWSLIKLFQILPKVSELSWRNSNVLVFSFCYVVCYIFFMATGNLQATGLKSVRVIFLYGVTTLYTIILQVMYLPLSDEVEEAGKRRSYDSPEQHHQYSDVNLDDMSGVADDKQDNIQLRNADKNRNRLEKTFDEDEVAI